MTAVEIALSRCLGDYGFLRCLVLLGSALPSTQIFISESTQHLTVKVLFTYVVHNLTARIASVFVLWTRAFYEDRKKGLYRLYCHSSSDEMISQSLNSITFSTANFFLSFSCSSLSDGGLTFFFSSKNTSSSSSDVNKSMSERSS